jgi:hypothetical protein
MSQADHAKGVDGTATAPARRPTTVFVIGAGASFEVGLPTGDALINELGELLDLQYSRHGPGEPNQGSPEIDRALRAMAGQIPLSRPVPKELHSLQMTLDRLVEASVQTSKGMSLTASIDNYLNSHQGNPAIVACGKLAITLAILRNEGSSKIRYIDRSNIYTHKINFLTSNKAYFRKLFQVLIDDCRHEDLPERLNSVAFIIFNYDRCIEHYFFNAFQTYYGIDALQASELLGLVKIHHPYGKVGALPWQGERTRAQIDFGAVPDTETLLQVSTQIRTFYEGVHADSGIAIREVVRDCQKLVFLGFAFHKQNMKLLFGKSSEQSLLSNKVVYGTAFGISSEDATLITAEISKRWKTPAGRVKLDTTATCADIFAKHSRGISV